MGAIRLDREQLRQLHEGLVQEQAQARVEDFVAEAAGVDGDVAKLEIGVLRRQIVCLQWWESHAERDTRAGFAFAVAALIEFYFGEADRHDPLLAETQLVWMASPSSPPLIASKAKRLRHKEIRQRYEDLWHEWARAHPARATA